MCSPIKKLSDIEEDKVVGGSAASRKIAQELLQLYQQRDMLEQGKKTKQSDNYILAIKQRIELLEKVVSPEDIIALTNNIEPIKPIKPTGI